jgi:hypothetical protein
MVGGIGVDVVVKFGPKVVIAMVFDAAACAGCRDRGQEVLYANWRGCIGWTCHQCYLWEEGVETL